ncbi:cadmium resistance transporter [Limosilactobacillus oris]
MNYWLLSLTFIAVNLDFFLIMLFLLRRYRVWDVAVGYTLGVVLLMSASYFIGQALALFLPEWILGTLGILPIYMAVHDNDDEAHDQSQHSPILATLMTYLAVCAGCNLAIFLPVLTKLSLQAFTLAALFIVLLSVAAVLLVKGIGTVPLVEKTLTNYGEILMKIIYIGVGLYVFYDSGLVSHLVALL